MTKYTCMLISMTYYSYDHTVQIQYEVKRFFEEYQLVKLKY